MLTSITILELILEGTCRPTTLDRFCACWRSLVPKHATIGYTPNKRSLGANELILHARNKFLLK